MVDQSDIAGRVKTAVDRYCEGATIEPDSNLRQALGLDDLDILELTIDIEEAFSIEISDEELVGVETVGDVISLVTTKAAR